MIVLDASAAIELLLRTAAGQDLARRLSEPGLSVHAPALIDVEVAQVFCRYVRLSLVSVSRARRAIEMMAALDVERHGHDLLLGRIWALRHNLTAYDAAYVALAEALGAPLITCDRKLAAATTSRVAVELLDAKT